MYAPNTHRALERALKALELQILTAEHLEAAFTEDMFIQYFYRSPHFSVENCGMHLEITLPLTKHRLIWLAQTGYSGQYALEVIQMLAEEMRCSQIEVYADILGFPMNTPKPQIVIVNDFSVDDDDPDYDNGMAQFVFGSEPLDCHIIAVPHSGLYATRETRAIERGVNTDDLALHIWGQMYPDGRNFKRGRYAGVRAVQTVTNTHKTIWKNLPD